MSIDLLAPKPLFNKINYYDPVDKPFHYNQCKIEPIDVIEDWNLNYHLGTTVKYISRYQWKGNPLQDLKKARWFLTRQIEKMEKEEHAKSKAVPSVHSDYSDLSSEKGTGVLGARTSL